MTVWTVIQVESFGNNEEMVTMRARSSFGLLPELNVESIPSLSRERVVASVLRVVDAAHRSGGMSLVDLCRDSVQIVLAAWIDATSGKVVDEKDLGKVIGELPEEMKLLRNAADTIRMLHPRGKSNEAKRLGTRPIDESDGQLALDAFGFVLRDIGWAK